MNSVERLLWWVIAGSQGGHNRARILHLLRDVPMNTNQIAKEMGVDYSTVQHHLKVLRKNNLVSTMGGKYGALYFLSPLMEDNWDVFLKIEERIGKKRINEKEDGDKDE